PKAAATFDHGTGRSDVTPVPGADSGECERENLVHTKRHLSHGIDGGKAPLLAETPHRLIYGPTLKAHPTPADLQPLERQLFTYGEVALHGLAHRHEESPKAAELRDPRNIVKADVPFHLRVRRSHTPHPVPT